jgi:hypothetical protein
MRVLAGRRCAGTVADAALTRIGLQAAYGVLVGGSAGLAA